MKRIMISLCRHLIENRIKYLVWTERQWPADKIDFSQVQHHLKLKGAWALEPPY